MSHPESDGIGEMLEGSHRAVLTGVQRWLELLNRRRADRAVVEQRIAEQSAVHDLAQRRIVQGLRAQLDAAAGLADPTGADVSRIDGDSPTSPYQWARPDDWERAELLALLTHGPAKDVDSRVDEQARILTEWNIDRAPRQPTGGSNVFDDPYYRTWAVMEATDAQLARAEERALDALAQAPAGDHRDPEVWRSTLLGHLGQVVAEDARAAFQSRRDEHEAQTARNIAHAPTELDVSDRVDDAEGAAARLATAQLYDTEQFRDARAAHLANEHYDADVMEAALLNDLAFGTPAAEAATAGKPPRRPARFNGGTKRAAIRQRSGAGR